ncbi:MAG TPA: lipopolysaccharide heptosyltransferase II [Vicinamibacterales bacterium]|nr:lipopolysaccharide heptosyltransferase II [Vicinamibacterales bacterium]
MTTVPQGPTGGNRLLILAPNWLGDAVMSLPAIADVVRSGRHETIAIAARPSIAPLFELVPGLSAVVDVGSPLVSGDAYDCAILLPNSFRSAWRVWRAGIRERWGYLTQGRQRLLTKGVALGPRAHQTAYYQTLTTALGYEPGGSTPSLNASDVLLAKGRDLLERAGWNGSTPLVGFAPGAANGRAKQWPSASYAGVVRALAEDRITPVLVGSPGDAQAGRDVLDGMNARLQSRVVNLIGRTDLPTLAGVLAHCRQLVCNDSGGMHFAAALGVNVTAMFGPSNERETHPVGGARTLVMTHAVWCRPCMLRECPLDHRCMSGITVHDVYAAVRETLRTDAAR